jgi:hypothetical protein
MTTVQVSLPVAAVLADAKQGLLELIVSTGVQVFEAVLAPHVGHPPQAHEAAACFQ